MARSAQILEHRSCHQSDEQILALSVCDHGQGHRVQGAREHSVGEIHPQTINQNQTKTKPEPISEINHQILVLFQRVCGSN